MSLPNPRLNFKPRNRMPDILIVEDDETMMSLLKTLLEIEGFQVTIFNWKISDDPLKLIHRDIPPIVLLDVHLHNKNGLEIIRQIREDATLKSVRVLMTSGMDMRRQCLEAGADGFLQKPYMPDDLVRMIRNNSSQ